jgi:hypothetical protein
VPRREASAQRRHVVRRCTRRDDQIRIHVTPIPFAARVRRAADKQARHCSGGVDPKREGQSRSQARRIVTLG